MKNTARIMKAAHAMTRRTLAQYPAADYRVTFAAALKIAWREDGQTAAEIWESYTPQEQYNALLAMAFYEYRNRDARINYKTGQSLPNVFYWVQATNAADDLRAVAHSAYIRLIDYLQDDEKNTRTLARLMSRAVIISAQAIARQERRNASALKQRKDDNGDTLDYIAKGRTTAEPVAPSPEIGAIIIDTIENAAADDLDRAIIKGLAQGYKLNEIARALDTPYRTIKYRAARIRSNANAE